MKTTYKLKNPLFQRFMYSVFLVVASFALLPLLSSCNSSKVSVEQQICELRIKEPIFLLPPVAQSIQMNQLCETLGAYYNVELPKRVKGQVVYAKNIDSLKEVLTWNNLMKNGAVNAREAAAIGKSNGCDSVLAIQIMNAQMYPPFRMVVAMQWIDCDTANIIGRLYQDVDLTDSETKYRFRNFVGQGPAKEVYEEFAYSEALYQTASLKPEEFKRFVAAYSATLLFGETSDFPWWMFWRSF